MENSNCITAPFRKGVQNVQWLSCKRQENPVAVLKVYLIDSQGITLCPDLPAVDFKRSFLICREDKGERIFTRLRRYKWKQTIKDGAYCVIPIRIS